MVPYTTIELIGASLFLIAIIHTFSTKYFEHLAHVHKRFSGILHLLGEIEVVFRPSKGQAGSKQTKTVTVSANTSPENTILKITAFVNKTAD